MKTKVFTLVYHNPNGGAFETFVGTLAEIATFAEDNVFIDFAVCPVISGTPVTLKKTYTVATEPAGLIADTTTGPDGGSVTKVRRGRGRPKKVATAQVQTDISATNGHVKDVETTV